MNKNFIVYHCNISHLFESINIYIYGSKTHKKKCIAFNDLMIFCFTSTVLYLKGWFHAYKVDIDDDILC